MKQQQVTVFGAGGFLGRYVIQRLARKGAVVRAVVRDTEAAGHLKTLGDPGQITLKRADVTDPKLVAAAVEGADVVINLVGIIVEKGSNTFEHIHIEGDENVAIAAREAGVKSLVHVSSVVANSESKTQYGRSKAEGDARVLAAFPNAVVLRPAWLIGAEDRFMKMFATMARFSPVLPVIGCPIMPKLKMIGGPASQWRVPVLEFCSMGGADFEPVYVGDVANAIVKVIDSKDARGKTYELVGPTLYTLKQLLELMLKVTQRKRLIMPLPVPLAMMQAFFLEMVPGKPLTRDMVRQITEGNVASGKCPGFKELGIEPVAIETVLPMYLKSYKPTALQRTREA